MRRSALLSLSATALLLPAAVASATTLASNTSSTVYNGYSSSSAPSTLAPTPVFDVGNGDGVWTAPIAGSTYISFEPGTNPSGAAATPANHAPNGYYTYTSTFLADTGATGSLTVLADDTVAVYLNSFSNQILMDAPPPYPLCASSTPNCTVPTTVALTGLMTGTNTLTFVVHQAADYATGLDFSGQVSAAPEPGTLALLGTGLVGGASMLLRRFRPV